MILHRQLKALLHRLGIEAAHPPEDDQWLALLVMLNDRFRQFEEERHRLQRSLDIHSREVQSLYKELTQERDKVSSVLDCLDGALLLLDGQGRPLLVSAEAERRLGFSEAELEGKNLIALLGIQEHLPPGGLPALLSGLRPVEFQLPIEETLTDIRLQPLIRERQLIGCLVVLQDPQEEQPPVTAEDLPAVEESELLLQEAVHEMPRAEIPQRVESPTRPSPLPSPQGELRATPANEGLAPELPATTPSRTEETPSLKPPEPGLRILVVESDPEFLASLSQQIHQLHHHCTPTADALEALRLYHDEPFDAIMCCEQPKHLSGVELCKRLRQDSRGGYPYFILMTPPGARDQAAKALEAGVDAFLNKPLENVELQVRLKVARGVQSRLSKVYSNLMPDRKKA